MKRAAFSPHDEVFLDHTKSKEKFNMPVQHYHEGYEIYLQLDGKRYVFYDNICYTLKRGDLYVAKPFDIHYAESGESDFYERILLNFRPEKLNTVLNKSESHSLLSKLKPCVVHLSEEQTNILYDCWKRVKRYSEEKGFLSDKLTCAAIVELIWHTIKFIDDETALKGETIPENVAEAIAYINDNYRKELNLDKICAAAKTSKYHFCHIFKDVTGATVMEYLNNVRLKRVHSLLINTEAGMDEIAEETGFVAATNLNRAFKKVYGVSPGRFRKNKKEEMSK